MTFPYISQIKVNNCFTFKDFSIPHSELREFRHIVLTGENGSGKTTILNRIAMLLSHVQGGQNTDELVRRLKGTIEANPKNATRPFWEQQLREIADIELKHLGGGGVFLQEKSDDYIFAFFRAQRKVELKNVNTVTKEEEFLLNFKNQNNTDELISQFKQYLVNKKVYEALDFMNSKTEKINENKIFFRNLTETLRSIFKDETLELTFVPESFEFYLMLKDGRAVTFNQLSEGFSAFLSIIMDLVMRTDLLRKAKNDYTLDPCGIVLIDEPETHFHLSMQYEILPLINRVFPNIQLIIATHSPAIISSIKNAIVYDLTSKQEVADWILGSSYSELMIKHFGLDNEYSPIADKILLDINNAVKEKNKNKLNSILIENASYLTPSLKLEIESQIIHINSRAK